VRGGLDGTVDLFIRHAASTDFCFAPDSLERLTSKFTLHSLLDDLVSGLRFGLGLLPDTLERVFRQGDVLFGLHGGVKQLFRRAIMTYGALLVRSWTALHARISAPRQPRSVCP
jgi:hypothetical protein